MPSSSSSKRVRPAPSHGADYERMLLLKELEWLRTLAYVAPCGMYRVDAAGRITYVNERWSEVTGYAANDALGQPWTIAVLPEDVPMMQAEWRRCIERRLPYRVEHRCQQPSGRVTWAMTYVVREVDGRGQPIGYTGITMDMTEQHRMREELQRSHRALEERMKSRSEELQRMARIVETIDDAVASCDMEGYILTWNRAAERIFGYTAAEMIGQHASVLVPLDQREKSRALREYAGAGNEVKRVEWWALRRDGRLLEMELSAFPLRDEQGTILGTWAIGRDVTALKDAERQMHRLSWQLMRVQEEERRRIARDLHDSTAQAVAALSMNLAALAREEAPLSEERRRQVLKDSLALAEQAATELRTTSYLLHPPLLDERGLGAALGWFIDGYTSRSQIRVALEVAPNFGRLPRDLETALFTVAREALHNVHRHAESERAEVRLTYDADTVRLEVRDWGKGMGPQPLESPGVGLAGMRERLLQFNGTLTVEAAEPGTRLIASIPRRP